MEVPQRTLKNLNQFQEQSDGDGTFLSKFIIVINIFTIILFFSCEDDLYSDLDDENSDGDDGFEESFSKYMKKKYQTPAAPSDVLTKILNSPDVVSTLDRVNLSDRDFVYLAAAFAKANNVDIAATTFSASTVARRRKLLRKNLSEQSQKEFMEKDKNCLVIHWDGKLMENTTKTTGEKNRIDRIAVVVTGAETSKLLAVPKTDSGSGEAQASVVFEQLQKWNLSKNTVGMSFDTTSSNTGKYNGACNLLEKKLKKNLLYLACRHHILEIVAASTFNAVFGVTTGPEVKLFNDFKNSWDGLDKRNYSAINDPRLKKPFLKKTKNSVVEFLKHALENSEKYCPRDDYKEICELCLVVLGERQNYKFRRPGATHHARWMAKIIYVFKIYLLRAELQLSTEVEHSLKELCIFYALIYVHSWITAPLTADAPVNDLFFFKNLLNFKAINAKISETAIEKFSNHLWYLSPEFAPLAIFSEKLTNAEKTQMQRQLKKLTTQITDERILKLNSLTKIKNLKMHDLLGRSSLNTFQLLGFDLDFL
jgi:hypothetical protein